MPLCSRFCYFDTLNKKRVSSEAVQLKSLREHLNSFLCNIYKYIYFFVWFQFTSFYTVDSSIKRIFFSFNFFSSYLIMYFFAQTNELQIITSFPTMREKNFSWGSFQPHFLVLQLYVFRNNMGGCEGERDIEIEIDRINEFCFDEIM